MGRWVIAVAVLLASPWARGDVVRLKSGGTIVGKIVRSDADAVTIRTGTSQMTVPRAKIASVERSEPPSDAYARRAAALDDDDVAGHFALADYAMEHRLRKEAVAQFRHVLAHQPDHRLAGERLRSLIDPAAASLLLRARGLQARREHAKAEVPLTQLLETYPESTHAAQAHHLLALGYAARGQHDQALTRWRRALNLRPDFAEACEGAAQACIETADWPEALRFTEQARDIRAGSPEAKGLQARADAVRELGQLAAQHGQAEGRADRLAREGRLLTALGLDDRGTDRLEAAYDAGAREPKLLAFLADYYESRGRVPQALELCKALAAADPTNAALRGRRTRLERLLLIPKAFATRDPRRRRELFFEIGRSRASFPDVEAALRNSTIRQPQKTGLVEGTFVADEILVRIPYACYVPNGYDPRRPWPLIIACHRDNDNGKEHFYNWESVAKAERTIILCPSAPRDGKWQFADLPIPLSALRHAVATYNIDTDRVTLAGTGAGGLLAWTVALRHPDRFAALVVRNAPLDEVTRLYLPAARNLPIYQLVSERAPPEIIGALREADSALARWNYTSRREEVPGHRHPAMPELNDKIALWLDDKKRDPYPHTVRLLSFQHENAAAYWLRIDRFASSAFDPDRKVTAAGPLGIQLTEEQVRQLYLARMERELASVAAIVAPGNRIRITTRHVLDLTVLLSDRLVDLDEPVRIYLNGELVHRDKVARSLETLFDTARRHHDSRLCYSAAVSLKVK